MSLEKLYELHQQKSKMNEFIDNLKKNPLQVSEYKQMIAGDTSLDGNEKIAMLGRVSEYKQRGLLKDDVKVTLSDFRKQVAETTPDKYVMPLSIYKQLDSEQMQVAHSVQLAWYDDLGGGINAKVNHYQDKYGLHKSGGGAGVKMNNVDLRTEEGSRQWNEAKKYYDTAQKQWSEMKKEIIEGRGSKYKEWHPLPDGVKPNESQR